MLISSKVPYGLPLKHMEQHFPQKSYGAEKNF